MPEIGAKLLKDGVITESDLRLAKIRERETGINVATCLVDLGKVEEAVLCRYIASSAHLPFIDDDALARVSLDLTSFVSAVTAGMFQAIPIDFSEGRLLVATSDPDLLKHLDPVGKDSGHPIDAAIATSTGIAKALERLYQITDATVPVDSGTLPAFSLSPTATAPELKFLQDRSITEVDTTPSLDISEDILRTLREDPRKMEKDLATPGPADFDDTDDEKDERPSGDTPTLRPGGDTPTLRPGGDTPTLRPGGAKPTLRPGGALEVPEDEQATIMLSAVRDHLQDELPPTEPRMDSVPTEGLDRTGPAPSAPPSAPRLQAVDAPLTMPLRADSDQEATRTMDAMVRPPKIAGGRFEDRYEIIKKIGAGGMAQVHLAEVKGAQGFHREVVIKKILPSLTQDEQFRKMFIDEANITCQLSHPNIVQLYELAEDRGQCYMVMEYVEGIDLGTLFRQAAGMGPKLSPAIAAYIVEQLCEGLDYAHKRTDDEGEPLGIVHRDVTPGNVLLSYDGHVKVIDFGIALAAENTSVTMVGALKGKPGYISPEQAEGKPLDHRSDVFAAGIILYELLMHKRLFRDALGAYELREVVEFDPRPKLRWKFRFPAALRAAASWALQASRDERCPDAAELAALLRDYLRKRREDPRLELQKYISAHIARPDDANGA